MQTSDIVVRRPRLDFDAEIDRYYLGDNAVKTHFFNALNLAFPDGERFFVKSVQDHKDRIDDPELLAQIKAFSGQEGQHANQHERFFRVLERQGYRVGPMLAWFNGLARRSNKGLPRALRLSITAGAEHYTATLASLMLEHDMLSDCNATMKDLMTWHAIEEIEHKSVAYDVLVACYPRNYLLRISGFMIASFIIAAWTLSGMRRLLMADGRARRLTREEYLRDRRGLADDKTLGFRRAVSRTLRQYFRPGFHPSQQDDQPLLTEFRPIMEARLLTATPH